MAKQRKQLSEKDVIKMRQMVVTQGVSIDKAADYFALPTNTVARAIKGDTYKKYGGPIISSLCGLRNGPSKEEHDDDMVQEDITGMTTYEAALLLQALSQEWPRLRKAFHILDEVIQCNG